MNELRYFILGGRSLRDDALIEIVLAQRGRRGIQVQRGCTRSIWGDVGTLVPVLEHHLVWLLLEVVGELADVGRRNDQPLD